MMFSPGTPYRERDDSVGEMLIQLDVVDILESPRDLVSFPPPPGCVERGQHQPRAHRVRLDTSC